MERYMNTVLNIIIVCS